MNVNTGGDITQVDVDATSDDGDSGVPYFDVNSDDEAYIGGLHVRSWDMDDDGDDDSRGHSAEWMENKLNLTI